MHSAKDARWLARSVDESNELWEIHKAVEAAAKKNLRFVNIPTVSTELVRDILELDYGYKFRVAYEEGEIVLKW